MVDGIEISLGRQIETDEILPSWIFWRTAIGKGLVHKPGRVSLGPTESMEINRRINAEANLEAVRLIQSVETVCPDICGDGERIRLDWNQPSCIPGYDSLENAHAILKHDNCYVVG